MSSTKLYTYQCSKCKKVFRTDDEGNKTCPTCSSNSGLSAAGTMRVQRQRKKHSMTINEVSYLEGQFFKAHKKSTTYGNIVNIITHRPNDCVVCGAYAPEGTHICSECKKL